MPGRSGKVEFDYLIGNERLGWLESYVCGWRSALDSYAAVNEGEPAYYFNERASISMLAAGAWLSGATALEEYCIRKDRGVLEKSGRCDLYIADHENAAEIEAKHKELSASCSDISLRKRIKGLIQQACHEASRNNGADTKIGCVFFVPCFPVYRFKDFGKKSEKYIGYEIERYIRFGGKVHLWSWYFPNTTRHVIAGNQTKYHFPGVIMALCEAGRRRQSKPMS